MNMSIRILGVFGLLFAASSAAQQPCPLDAPIVPGITPDEHIDVTGDGTPDLVITSVLDPTPDPEQGLFGWYRRHVRTLPGTSLLSWSTHNNYGYYILDEGASIDTAALAKNFHFKQLQWTPSEQPREFRLLQQAYGPGITKDMAGWYGTGEYADGTMILRSVTNGKARIAAFTISFAVSSGCISITTKEVLNVHRDFGKAGDPPPPLPPVEDPFSFGHEPSEPPIVIPPGIPPIERVDLTFDENDDVLIIGIERTGVDADDLGYYVRGVSPAPGAAFLMKRDASGEGWDFYRLPPEGSLTADILDHGLQAGTFVWATPEREGVFCPVLQQRITLNDKPQEWTYVYEEDKGDPVFRTMHHGQPVIGVVALRWSVPGGELGIDPQNWVEEGKVLQVR